MDILELIGQDNVLEHIPDKEKETTDILDRYNEAQKSMIPWLKKYKKALFLAKLQPSTGGTEITKKTFPFEGASLAMLPFILEAMLDFQSRATPDLVWAKNIVKFKIYGKDTEDEDGNSVKEAREKRLSTYSNYQLSEEIPNWREGQDKALLILPCVGTFYKKTYWDSSGQDVCSDLVLAENVIFDHGCASFEESPDKFQVCKYKKNDVIGFIRGLGWDIEEDELQKDQDEFDFLEAYTWIDMDKDGLKEPYHVIIWQEKERIVYILPEYDEDDITRNDEDKIVKVKSWERFTQYRFIPDPDGGPMGLGWGILLGPMFDAINANLRQMIDAETVSITAGNSGLIAADTTTGRGNSVQSGPIKVKLAELTKVSTRGMQGSLSQNISQFPFRGANETMFRLIEWLSRNARELTTAALRIEAVPNEAASLYLARLTQGLKVPNSIIMRVFASCAQEFSKIRILNFKHFDNEKYNRVLDEDREARMDVDFDPKDCDLKLARDPTQGSDIERSARAEAILLESKENPTINKREATLNWMDSIGEEDPKDLVPEPQPDPFQEMMVKQAAMEAEFKDRELKLRERTIAKDEHKLQLEAARDMKKLGMDVEKVEAEILEKYVKMLVSIAEVEIEGEKLKQDSLVKGIGVITNLEKVLIDGNKAKET